METLVDEIITEILSWLPVKSLVRFRCVSKSWNSLILHPTFVNLHLERSPKNANFVLSIRDIFDYKNERDTRVVLCSKRSFMENPASTIAAQEGKSRLNNKYWVIGSCNGLLCLRGHCYGGDGDHFGEYWVRFWNPATRLRSKKSPHLCVDLRINRFGFTKFGFGYDKSSDTYKVVVILTDRNATDDSKRTQVKVYTMGDNCWRDIQRFPAFPIIFQNEGRFLSGTLNWLAVQNEGTFPITIDQLVIVSLDLGKETYKQMLLPRGLDETTEIEPNIVVLGDCLCLFHDYKETHFVVWQMKEFGVEESWTPFVNVSYQHLQIQRDRWPWPQRLSALPLCISENGDDVLMLIGHDNYEIVLYYRRDNRVEHTDIPKTAFGWMSRILFQAWLCPVEIKFLCRNYVKSSETPLATCAETPEGYYHSPRVLCF